MWYVWVAEDLDNLNGEPAIVIMKNNDGKQKQVFEAHYTIGNHSYYQAIELKFAWNMWNGGFPSTRWLKACEIVGVPPMWDDVTADHLGRVDRIDLDGNLVKGKPITPTLKADLKSDQKPDLYEDLLAQARAHKNVNSSYEFI